MKCKKCGAELKETDTICLNCGALVTNSINDLYDDINTDEDDDSFLDDNDNDSAYNKELDDLLNSYKIEDKKGVSDDFPDYSSFNELNENKSIDKKEDEDTNEDSSITIGSDGLEDYTIDNLIDFRDTGSTYKDYDSVPEEKEKKKFNLNISIVPFKVIFVIALIVLIIVSGIFGYKYFSNKKSVSTEYEINKEEDNVTSKYSLTKNPNYIKGKTWVCGETVDGNLTGDRSTYFQYDFNNNATYAREFLNRPDTYENGKYYVSLEDTSNDQYLYKLYMIANLDGGYKTKYTFTLLTNKEGTKATYKYNSTEFSCEEMDYYNSKIGG